MSVQFVNRHIGPNAEEAKVMLATIGAGDLNELIEKTISENIRINTRLNLSEPLSEYEYSQHISELAGKNKVYKSYIGLGYYNTIVPAVIQRNIFENPGWYTAYTPYQAEIAQGRLEALLNFQTMVTDLTGMELANASLLDEATAAAEAMHMFYAMRSKDQVKAGANQFFVSKDCFPQTIDVLKTRSAPIGVELIIGDHRNFTFTDKVFGLLLQYPSMDGEIHDYRSFVANAKANNIFVSVATDILSLTLLTPPGEWGADAVVGSTQRFGVPMGFGGPHAAFFATKEDFKRFIPGRIIGVSIDSQGNRALRMALQTREQHIKRDKATSNICTAQALLAIMAGMYACYHGADGLRRIGTRVSKLANALAGMVEEQGYKVLNANFFDTITISSEGLTTNEQIRKEAEQREVNLRYNSDGTFSISIDETTSFDDILQISDILAVASGKTTNSSKARFDNEISLRLNGLNRQSAYLTHPVFNTYHSETEMMRYIKKLENRDLSLTHSMIALGSCTMKLNAASELMPLSKPEFAHIHPFVPADQVEGYLEMLRKLEDDLCEITGFAAVSLQPNSGAQGEYTGLMVIRAYHLHHGDHHRNIALIPSSAHGTNPASAVMAGMEVVVVKCDEEGNVDIADLRTKAEQHKDRLAALMITYPSTHGVFEEGIREITGIIHEHGGLVYMDGANMNAQVGLTNPAAIGADVCHLNLHKTFAIPHGGGGPGMGPIGVTSALAPFLPGHSLFKTGGAKGIHAVSATPFGSALILLVSYAYIRMLGADGVTDSTKFAILNANYLKARLEKHYPILYKGKHGTVAHEMILDCREFKRTSGVEVADIAKRLMDYGFHAPTVSFPVPGTIMVEPTESESLHELDRFAEAMIAIRNEIAEIEEGIAAKDNNVIINAPHTARMVTSDSWNYPYSRQKAAYPLPWVADAKFWPSVGKIDNAYGDRNLICTCPAIESYENKVEEMAH
ncbi:MAG: aminomethyl-transferring glycine dehydrogenase [Flavobacteriales bacterium]